MRLSGTKTSSIHQYRGLGNQLWDLSGQRPSLDLQFADNKSLADAVTGQSLVTFTRASSATYVGSDGLIKTAAVNEPRFDHNPTTGESLGLLVEEQRTNSIRNNTMVGAVAGTPGTLPTNWSAFTSLTGITREIVGTGTENGITYIDFRLSGTPSAAGSYFLQTETNTQIAALNGQSWTSSLYAKLAAGSLTGISSVKLAAASRDSSGNAIAATETTFTPTSASLVAQRAISTHTNASASTAYELLYIVFALTGTTIDITLRIGLPQLEQGDFATSVIPTSTAAVTRSADVASVTGTAFSSWYRQDEGTVFAEARTNATHGGTNSFPRVFALNDGGNNNNIEGYFRVLSSYTDAGYRVDTAGVNQAQFDTNDQRNGQRQSIGYAVNNFAFVVGGATVNTDTSGSVPVTTQLRLGARGDGSSIANGTIRRLAYWPQRLANSTLQAITQ